MPLPDEHLRYPLRRYGMDQDWYDWALQPERKPVAWPGGARIALWLVPALEFFPLNQPAKPFKAPGGMVTPYPDLRHYTLRDYGNRVGVFRVFKVLDRLGITASVAMNAKVAERAPFLVEEVNRRGWEIIAYGVDMGRLHYGGMDIEEETALIKDSVETLRGVSGQPVTGWLSPAKSESMNTLDLVAAQGIEYVCDWISDDMPFPLRTKSGEIHSLPLSHEISDQMILHQYQHSEQDFVDQVTDQFDVLYREATPEDGRIMTLTIHPWMSGQPHRIKHLERALAHIMGHDGVWSATGAEILAAYKTQAGPA
ncbi:MAG: polysaccharide deacetylase family protein [Alphaproteobacteria bacterium]|nr:polysaccharide deacetylase family protein [Alphaproteobacteria bacterium]